MTLRSEGRSSRDYFEENIELHIHVKRGARVYNGVWGRSPQLGPGAEPLQGSP